MPPLKIPSLETLCIKNIATNVVRHSKHFVEIQNDSKTYRNYEIARSFFSDAVLKAIEHVYYNEEAPSVHHFIIFAEFLLEGKFDMGYSDYYRSSLKFLFNKYTMHASLPWSGEPKVVPAEIVSAISQCKNLKSLRLHSGHLTDSQFSELLACRDLVEVDLLCTTSCTDATVVDILRNCQSLKMFRASGKLITDKCLLQLCSNNRAANSFVFCQNGGMCCSLGKNLIKLLLHGTVVTKMGIACALQHLPLLEKFVDGGLLAIYCIDYHFVPHGICELQRAAIASCGSPINLKLTMIVFDEIEWSDHYETVRKCCPNLNAFVCCYGPLRILCSEWDEKLKPLPPGLHYHGPAMFSVSVIDVIRCLNLQSMEQFSGYGKSVLITNLSAAEVQVPSSVHNLEYIHLAGVECDERVLEFFSDLLSQAFNVKSLTLSYRIAEEAFLDAIETNTFRNLEEIVFSDANVGHISVKKLIKNGTKLKRITLRNCKHAAIFIKRHKACAHKNNFSLDIEKFDKSLSCWATIKFGELYVLFLDVLIDSLH